MHLGWSICVILISVQVMKIATAELAQELQSYESLIPLSSSHLYETCLEENLPDCDVFMYDELEKRSPKFNSWGGKRAFSSWGGKRAQFSSWGGKRSPQFSSWGGKRDPQMDDIIDDEYLDMLDKRAKFSNWGGKRDMNEIKRKFNSWGGKRGARFSSWAGKRTPELFLGAKRGDVVGYKRKPAFSSWGGKRSEEANFLKNGQDLLNGDDHSIKKRETQEVLNGQAPDLWKEFFDRISNPNFNKNNPQEHLNIESTMASPVKKSTTDSNIQKLFQQFVYWTGNQPEEKKNLVMNSQLFKDLNVGTPMRRGSVDFYAWGGKRSETTK